MAEERFELSYKPYEGFVVPFPTYSATIEKDIPKRDVLNKRLVPTNSQFANTSTVNF